MKNKGVKTPELRPGQLWRLKRRYLLIVALENLCVRFKLMDAPDEFDERTLSGDADTVMRYLVSRHGQLIQPFRSSWSSPLPREGSH